MAHSHLLAIPSSYTHARGVLNTSNSLPSLLSASVPSSLIKMLLIRAPGVINLNIVPRS